MHDLHKEFYEAFQSDLLSEGCSPRPSATHPREGAD